MEGGGDGQSMSLVPSRGQKVKPSSGHESEFSDVSSLTDDSADYRDIPSTKQRVSICCIIITIYMIYIVLKIM